MSLNDSQRHQTSLEFQANWDQAGIGEEVVERDLDMAPSELHAILRMDSHVDPARVWFLRDYLDQAIRLQGGTPSPWGAMTESRRADAQRWFGLDEAPRPSSL